MKFKTKGFTLIELILVTAIIGVFAAGIIAVVNPTQQVLKANDARRKSDLSSLQKALEAYYADNGRYPTASSSNNIFTTTTISWGGSWQPYIDVVPKDPRSGRTYVYYASADGQSYALYASLERGNDPQACNGGNACVSLVNFGLNNVVCGSTCNYGVASADINP